MRDLLAAMHGYQCVVHVQRPEQRTDVVGYLLAIEFTSERRMHIMEVSALDRQHDSDVFFALKEMPSVSGFGPRSEEHTSELQSRRDLVCRLLLEKKKKK